MSDTTTRWAMATDATWPPNVDDALTKLARSSEDFSAGVVSSVGRTDAGAPTFIASVCHMWRDVNHEEDGFDYLGVFIDLSDPEEISPIWGRIGMEDLEAAP